MARAEGRRPDQLRPVIMTPNFVIHPEGSVLVETGRTKVLCNATLENKVPNWMSNRGKGWITAEYSMLPRSGVQRSERETKGLKGRTQEIQRLIGRSLRAALDLDKLGERSLIIDCDVLQADGGTRTASVTGGYVAVALALRRLIHNKIIPAEVLREPVAAVSVGIVGGVPLLDLDYSEDVRAEVDANVVMTAGGDFVEVQGTAEGKTFNRKALDQMLALAESGIRSLLEAQQDALRRAAAAVK